MAADNDKFKTWEETLRPYVVTADYSRGLFDKDAVLKYLDTFNKIFGLDLSTEEITAGIKARGDAHRAQFGTAVTVWTPIVGDATGNYSAASPPSVVAIQSLLSALQIKDKDIRATGKESILAKTFWKLPDVQRIQNEGNAWSQSTYDSLVADFVKRDNANPLTVVGLVKMVASAVSGPVSAIMSIGQSAIKDSKIDAAEKEVINATILVDPIPLPSKQAVEAYVENPAFQSLQSIADNVIATNSTATSTAISPPVEQTTKQNAPLPSGFFGLSALGLLALFFLRG